MAGSLGDRTKNFEFEIRFTGLGAHNAYPIMSDGAVPVDGFTGETFDSDGDGCATLRVLLRDDASVEVEGIPPGAGFEVTEAACDHRAAFEVRSLQQGQIRSDENRAAFEPLSTGVQQMTAKDTYTVAFVNERDLASNTGVLSYGVPAVSGIILLACGSLILRRRGNDIDES